MTSGPEHMEHASILVIEDEPLIRETLADMLSLGGHQVTLAESGEDGIRLFYQQEYDIVLTDLAMPGVSGWEVARSIREQRKDVPIVIVTGWGVTIERSEMEENGVDDVLPKPFDIDHVLNLVQTLLMRQSADKH